MKLTIKTAVQFAEYLNQSTDKIETKKEGIPRVKENWESL